MWTRVRVRSICAVQCRLLHYPHSSRGVLLTIAPDFEMQYYAQGFGPDANTTEKEMSETQNGSRDSVDTGPLTLDQLSDHELTIILSIEHQLQYTRVLTRSDKNAKPYLAPVQVRRPQVLLLDGARGTGKTSLLLTMAHRWNRHDGCDVEGHDRNDRDKQRTIRICDRLQLKHDGTLPEHIHPLRILDFDPLPPQMPLMAGIVQAWQPLAQEYDRLSRRPEECDDEDKTLEDYWNTLFRVATVGWSALPAARGLLEQVLDQQEQVSQWQRLGQLWQEFVTRLIVCGKCLRDAHKLRGEPVFVIMIDDVDLQVERIRELLPALRLLYHPNGAHSRFPGAVQCVGKDGL